jgi:glycosyltransferase involved in cell wall biosynthesis
MLAESGRQASVRYERIAPGPGRLLLGGLRNITLDLARGDYCMQWDDDEWYHPRRIELQMRALAAGAGGCLLRDTLMHLDAPGFVERPYRTGLTSGTPGTILHRRTRLRYPDVRKGEDSLFRDALRKEMPVAVLDRRFSHLFIRCFHGANTWARRHFCERLHYTLGDKLEYARAKYLRGDLFTHRAFQLTTEERAAVRSFLDQSRELNLLTAHDAVRT